MTPWMAAGAVLVLALAGCASKVGPPPASSVQAPAAWRTAVGPQAGAPADERTWWQAFGDPALSALVDAALAHNADLRIARERVQEYRARVTVADASRAPQLNLSAGPLRARALGPTGHPYVTNLVQAELQASYELDVWGRLANLSDAAAAAYRAEQASVDAAALSIAASVASGYLNLRGLDAQLELALATLKLREQSRDLALRQFEVGYSSRLESLLAQSEYHATAELVPQLQRAIFEQENALALLAGANPGAIARGKTLAELMPPAVPVGLPSELLRRRPDIHRAESIVAAQDASLAAARDQMLPTFRLTAAGGIQGTSLSQFVNSPTALWHVGAGVLAPLLEGGRLQAQTDIAAAQRNQAIFAYENVVRNAFAETDNSLGALYRLRQQAEQTDARRANAAETLRIAHNRYRNGYASYLEELDAQRTLYNADVVSLQLKTRILVSSVDLYRAMGGGWAPQP